MKYYAIIFVVLVAIAIYLAVPRSSEVIFYTSSGEVKVTVEVADSDEERQFGLMYRESLEGGMLFVFDGEGILGFWMKNTLIPLDMIFVNKDLEIVTITEAVPCEEDPCTIYYSDKPAMYVVEVNQGFSNENELKIGDKISIIL